MEALAQLCATVHVAGLMQAVGVAVFALLVAGPPPGPFAIRLFFISAVASLIAGALWPCAVAAHLAGAPSFEMLATMVLRTAFGHGCVARLGLLVVAAALAPIVSDARAARVRLVVAATVAAAALASIAFAGHAWASGPDWPFAGVYVAHLVAAAVWLGGLVPFAVALRRARAGDDPVGIAAIARRFSALAAAAVAALTASGVVNAALLVGGFAALVAEPYGRLLMTKLGLFTAMLALAAANRWVLVPRLARGERAGAGTALARNAALEFALGIAVVAVAIRLGASPPPTALP
ncbi:MAG: CopD family protein [Gemmatimonas sp.]